MLKLRGEWGKQKGARKRKAESEKEKNVREEEGWI
jgi:hypothetical protein